MSKLSTCQCKHLRGQHAQGTGPCDNCNCSEYVSAGSATPCDTSSTETSNTVADNRGVTASGLKDSGQRLQFASGMVRDVEADKPGFHFLIPKDIPFEKQMLTRVAEHLRKGAKKYTPRNWEKGNTYEEAERARESALRHMMQWLTGETDEDHAAAVITNVIFAETMTYKADTKKEED